MSGLQVLALGIDIGSASSKCVVLSGGFDIAAHCIVPTGTGTSGPGRAVEAALTGVGVGMGQISYVVATGYGRNTFDAANETVSEISCHAKGAVFIMPEVRTVIDIGGQDVKALAIGADGKLDNFVMNDKCAAGTGRFLEVMARVFELEVDELARQDEKAAGIIPVSSTCVVFSEAEVISQLANNAPIPDLIVGIHQSAAARAVSLLKRIGVNEPLLMTGGVANNAGVVNALKRALGVEIKTSEYSQLAGALGAAVYAMERLSVMENEKWKMEN